MVPGQSGKTIIFNQQLQESVMMMVLVVMMMMMGTMTTAPSTCFLLTMCQALCRHLT